MTARRVLCVLVIQLVSAKDDEVLVEMAPETIIEGFKTMMTSGYLRSLADDFAAKAAQHLIEELQKKKNKMQSSKDLTRLKADDQEPKSIFNKPGVKNPKRLEVSLLGSMIPQKSHGLVDHNDTPLKTAPVAQIEKESKDLELKAKEKLLLKLLREPAPDGDYPDREAALTDYESNKIKTPVITKDMINGKHFRRISIDFIFI